MATLSINPSSGGRRVNISRRSRICDVNKAEKFRISKIQVHFYKNEGAKARGFLPKHKSIRIHIDQYIYLYDMSMGLVKAFKGSIDSFRARRNEDE